MVMLVYQRVSHKSGEHLESANNLYGSIKGENLQETMDLRPKFRGHKRTESRFLWDNLF